MKINTKNSISQEILLFFFPFLLCSLTLDPTHVQRDVECDSNSLRACIFDIGLWCMWATQLHPQGCKIIFSF